VYICVIRGKIPNLKIVMKKIVSIAVCVAFLLVNLLQAQNEPAFIEIKGRTLIAVTTVAFSSDGKKVVLGGYGNPVFIFDAETGKELKKLAGHTDSVWSAAFSPDGKKVITGSGDGTARIWDAETGKELQQLTGHTGLIKSAAFSPDGKKVMASSCTFDDMGVINGMGMIRIKDKNVRVWDAETGEELKKLEIPPRLSVTGFSPDGKKVVTENCEAQANIYTAHILDIETGEELKQLEGHTRTLQLAVFSADGKRVLTSSHDKTARIWDVATGRELYKLEGHKDFIFSAAFSPDGKKVITGGANQDNTARIWDLERLPPPFVPPAIMDF
jgi:WD40 repeat protein